jgi:pimeloyl-ACP methyl ester carboxylesterase
MLQQTVVSADGTPIAYWRSGDGPPLVLVHGSFDDHNVWAPVLPAFEERFTVYAVDRRGRGGSGDGIGHSLESEAADIAEVVESIGGQEEVNLLGHSYGGGSALWRRLVAPRTCAGSYYTSPLCPPASPSSRRGL